MELEIPQPVRAVLEALEARGHEARLVGGCVRDLLRGVAVRDFDVATSAPVASVLALFPRAVPIGASARHGTAMVPSAAGPIDVTSYRGATLAEDLALRDFTVNAMALDAKGERLFDPFAGQADWRAGRLRAVGSARARFAEDPLRALRAARFVAELGLAPDAEVVAAMGEQRTALAAIAPERVRTELFRCLAGPHAEAALELLARSGLAEALAPGVRPDAARVVASLPREPALRLAGFLRGANAARALARLRVGRHLGRPIERLLALHAVGSGWDGSAASARKLRRRAGDAETLAALLALFEAERRAAEDGGGLAALAALRSALAAESAQLFSPRDLALRGGDVVALMGERPGPRIGRALRYLLDCAAADPSLNTPERLRAILTEWVRSGEP